MTTVNEWLDKVEAEEAEAQRRHRAEMQSDADKAIAAATALCDAHGLTEALGLTPFVWAGEGRSVWSTGQFECRGKMIDVRAMCCFGEEIVSLFLRRTCGAEEEKYAVYGSRYAHPSSREQVQADIASKVRTVLWYASQQ